MKEMTVTFIREKETKNTIRFQEKPPTGKPPIIGTLYIQKWAVGAAEKVELTLAIGDGSADFT